MLPPLVWRSSAATGVSGGGGVNTKDEGSAVDTPATTLNFVGAGVTATSAGGGTTTVTITGGGTPASPDKSIQFNNGGAFGGDADLLWDSGTTMLTIGAAGTTPIIEFPASATAIATWRTNAANTNTNFVLTPSGTGTTSNFKARTTSNLGSAGQYMQMFMQHDIVGVIDCSVINAGTQCPMEIRIGASAAIMIDITKNVQLKAGFQRPTVVKTANYTILETDGVVIADCTGGNVTLTLPAANVAGAGFSPNFRIKRKDSSANTVTVARAGADTIDGGTTYALGALQSVDLESDGVSAWYAL